MTFNFGNKSLSELQILRSQLEAEIDLHKQKLNEQSRTLLEAQKRDAARKISELTNQASNLLSEAETLARQYDLSFHWDGPDYGMGGGFYDGQWNSSSNNC